MKRITDVFRELREDRDLSQTQIANVLGISQQHYSKYETGEHELPLRHFITLAEYFDVSADYLIGRRRMDDQTPMQLVYVTKDCTCEQLIQKTLSLSEKGRRAVVEYVELQMLWDAANNKGSRS